MSDAEFMAGAVRLAAAGLGATYPNPCVGAIVVRRGRVTGRGRSAPTGGPHAETRALDQAGSSARGATLYVTLEPCCHVGRTGPCTEAIVRAGIARVVIGIRDPAPHVDGKGIRRLRRAGVEVEVGVLAERCAEVHEHYLHHVRTGRPFVTLKSATSLDGCLATRGGDSRWITGPAARTEGHRQRARHHAIAVGVGTVLADDPRLDVRRVRGTDPIPVVFDSRLRAARAATGPRRVLRPGTLVLHTAAASAAARRRTERTGAELVEVDADASGRVSVEHALERIGGRGIRSLLVEGGGNLVGSCVRAASWQRWLWFVAPRILGEGVPAVAGLDVPRVEDAPELHRVRQRRLGEDWLWVFEPTPR